MDNDLKKILHNYNLLDDYFIDQDSTTTTGEINAEPIDDAVFVGRYKDIYAQKELMETAIEKIYKGYNAAFDKSAYKAQFDIYPMRDFDEYMASLGAIRSDNGIDFIGIGAPVDWIAITKEEISKRLAERQKIEDDQKIEEEIAKKVSETDVIENYNVASDIAELKKYLQSKDSFKDQLKDIKSDAELVEVVNILYKRGDSSGTPFTSLQKMEINNWITTNLKAKATSEERKIEGESLRKKEDEASELKKSSQEQIDLLKKKIEENKSKIGGLDSTQEQDAKLISENEKLNNLIKAAETGRSKIIKGVKITEQQLKDIHNTIGSDFERKMSKYDGFTTVGPFCKEKRDYFINIFRPSISHFDTEFREAIPTKVAVKDTGNSIVNFIAKKGSLGAPEEPIGSVDPTLDNGVIINGAGFDNKTIKGVNELKKTGNADMIRDGKINELSDYLNEFLFYVENLLFALYEQNLESKLNSSQENVTRMLNLRDIISKLSKDRIKLYNDNKEKNSLKLNDSESSKNLKILYARLLDLYDQNLDEFNQYFSGPGGPIPIFFKRTYYDLKAKGLF